MLKFQELRILDIVQSEIKYDYQVYQLQHAFSHYVAIFAGCDRPLTNQEYKNIFQFFSFILEGLMDNIIKY